MRLSGTLGRACPVRRMQEVETVIRSLIRSTTAREWLDAIAGAVLVVIIIVEAAIILAGLS